jgi:hypothetical protein
MLRKSAASTTKRFFAARASEIPGCSARAQKNSRGKTYVYTKVFVHCDAGWREGLSRLSI